MSERQETNPIAVLGIGTAVPPYRLEQEDASNRLAEALGHSEAARWAKRIFKHSAVETRYTVEPNLLEPASRCRYIPGADRADIPPTADRMRMYRTEAVPLALEAARRALAASGVAAKRITHVIAVSCTGQFLPGLDTELVHRLELAPDTTRLPLTFVGCAAGLAAIRIASGMAERQPNAQVLVVCVELCTLHIQPSGEREELLGAALFGDGASACVVGRAGGSRIAGGFAIGRSRSVLFPEGDRDMVWTVGNEGFNLYLSPQIPELLAKYVPAEIERFLDGEPLPEGWAIHPGGRAIVDTLQSLYELSEAQTQASRKVLRQYGNMSSVTILFVLQELLQQWRAQQEQKRAIAIAFGPGLSVELVELTYWPAQ
ncbi:type III polyketide synthase [Paenibacillus koleovorans]|uniref:type III polyketide synthase n=1 Tax=Paenibacillus koleovorans TaxID=121608 RepID=UPI000FDC4DC6|nr:type III polyketide synthase [Paenibacillus koleovorans]